MSWMLFIVIYEAHPGTPGHPGLAGGSIQGGGTIPGLAPSVGIQPSAPTVHSTQTFKFATRALAEAAKAQIIPLYSGATHAVASVFAVDEGKEEK